MTMQVETPAERGESLQGLLRRCKSAKSDWFWDAHPSQRPKFCWVWGATVTGWTVWTAGCAESLWWKYTQCVQQWIAERSGFE